MLDFEGMLRPALARLGSTAVAMATPYELPERIARDLLAEGLFQSLIVDSSEGAKLDPTCAGWWVDRGRGRIFLRRDSAPILLIAGVDRSHRVGGPLLLEARLKRVERIVTTDLAGNIVEDLNVRESLHDRIDDPPAAPRVGSVTFEEAYDLVYKMTGDALRLNTWDFKDKRAMLALGGLGPGGAERQAALSAAGVQRSSVYDAYVLCSFLDAPSDFFKPIVENSGAKTLLLDPNPSELLIPEVVAAAKIFDEKFSALKFGDIYREIVRYAAAIRKIRPAVVHCWMDYTNVLCGTAARLVGAPGILLSGRSMAPSHFRIFQPYMRAGYRSLLNGRHIVQLNNSQAGASDYEAWVGQPMGSIRVIHNGFEFPERDHFPARKSVRDKFGVPQNAPLVGSILRFSEEKRPKLAIDMAIAINRQNPEVRFLFCGGGVQLEEMRAYVASHHLQEVIRLPGLVTESWDVLAAMDCFVLTSRMEGLPNVLVEAQASGLPVICTAVGGMVETYAEGSTGIGVRNPTGQALANTVIQLLEDRSRLNTMSQQARRHARATFGVSRMISETIDAYSQAVTEGQTQKPRLVSA
ncbi:MAG TPA: glycosyltransferase [Terriglobales bacterium]